MATKRSKRSKGGKSRLLTAAGYAGDGRNMRAASKRGNASPTLYAGVYGRIEPVTLNLTEATRRFPWAYGAPWLYPEVS